MHTIFLSSFVHRSTFCRVPQRRVNIHSNLKTIHAHNTLNSIVERCLSLENDLCHQIREPLDAFMHLRKRMRQANGRVERKKSIQL